MTGQTRRKPSVPAPAPQRTAATHASGAHEFSYGSFIVSTDTISCQCPDSSRRARHSNERLAVPPLTTATFV